MRNILKDFEKRVARLEQRGCSDQDGLVWIRFLNAAERDGLMPGQRIVEDDYENADGKPVMIVERITGDPSDIGKRFPEGSWNRKAFDQYNRNNPSDNIRIVWRKNSPPKPIGSLPGKRPRRGGARRDTEAAASGTDKVPSICPDGEPKPQVGPIVECSAEGTGANADMLEVLASEVAMSDNDGPRA